MGEINKQIKAFYKDLHDNFIETIIDENEQLSICELVKRLVTIDDFKFFILRT